jgi:hypothetical protein
VNCPARARVRAATGEGVTGEGASAGDQDPEPR